MFILFAQLQHILLCVHRENGPTHCWIKVSRSLSFLFDEILEIRVFKNTNNNGELLFVEECKTFHPLAVLLTRLDNSKVVADSINP